MKRFVFLKYKNLFMCFSYICMSLAKLIVYYYNVRINKIKLIDYIDG